MPTKTTRTGKHVNRVIDMWLKNQPVYYAQISGGGYEEGKKMAATKADYITYEMEHGPLDFKELREFMRGLVEAGPTRTGHKTPAVVVTLPISGTTDALRANAWMIQQTLAAGVHGILLCNAESPEAARLMIEAARYPFAPRVDGLAQGTRGNGSQGYASTIWGVTRPGIHAHRRSLADEPRRRVHLRPEDRESARRRERRNVGPRAGHRVRGMGSRRSWLLPAWAARARIRAAANRRENMAAVRRRVLDATKAAGVKFLNACNEKTVIDQLKEGVMICTGGDSPAADIGRKFSNRTDPF